MRVIPKKKDKKNNAKKQSSFWPEAKTSSLVNLIISRYYIIFNQGI